MTEIETGGRACPSCGKEASGNFCQNCGASLGGRFCNKCGAALADGARFCNQCGAARSAGSGAAVGGGATAGGAARGAASAAATGSSPRPGAGARRGGGASRDRTTDSAAVGNLPWIVAGVSLFALILVVGFNMIQPAGPAPATGQPAAGSGAGVAPDISQMTPLEAADRLYNRVMSSMEAGDTAGAQAFLPMAVGAYQRAEPLNLDGIFHLAMLEMIGDPAAALASAERILEAEPNHVFGLAMKGEAHRRLGEDAEARAAYQQLVDSYDVERVRTLQEYAIHAQLLDAFRQEAEAYLSGG